MAIDFVPDEQTSNTSTIDFVPDEQSNKYPGPKKALSNRGATLSFLQGLRMGLPDISKNMPEGIKLKYPKEIDEGLKRTFKEIDEYKPGGFTEKLLRAGGAVTPMVAFSKPFMKMPGMIPGVKALPAIIKSGLGFGAYEGTKAKLGGEEVLPAAVGGAASGMAFHGAGKLLSSIIPRWIPGAERIGSTLAGMGVGAVTSPDEPLVGATVGGAFGAKYPSQRISRFNVPIAQREYVATKLIKDVLGLKTGDYKYGSPSLAVIKEGITGKNIEEFNLNLSNKIDEISTDVSKLLSASSKKVKLSNYESALRPLIELRARLRKAPDVNASQIKAIDDILNNLKGYSVTSDGVRQLTKYPLSTATPADAFKVKQTVSQLIKNAYESPSGGTDLAKALKETNFKLVKLISSKVGDIKGIDSKYIQSRLKTEALLLTAKKALDNNILSIKAKESILPEFLRGGRIGAGIGAGAGGATMGLFGGLIGTYTGAQLERILLTPTNRIKLANWLIQTPKPEINAVYQKYPQLKVAIDKIKSKLPKVSKYPGLSVEDVSGSEFGNKTFPTGPRKATADKLLISLRNELANTKDASRRQQLQAKIKEIEGGGPTGKVPFNQPKGGGQVHTLTPEQQKQVDKLRITNTSGVELDRDITVKDIQGNPKTYKAGESIMIYKDTNTGKAIVKDGDYGILPNKSTQQVEQSGYKTGTPFIPAEEKGIVPVLPKPKYTPTSEAYKKLSEYPSEEYKEILFKAPVKTWKETATFKSFVRSPKRYNTGGLGTPEEIFRRFGTSSSISGEGYILPWTELQKRIPTGSFNKLKYITEREGVNWEVGTIVKNKDGNNLLVEGMSPDGTLYEFVRRSSATGIGSTKLYINSKPHRIADYLGEDQVKTYPRELIAPSKEVTRIVTKREQPEFKQGHFSEPDVFAHARLNNVVDSTGKTGLFIEELQSDWNRLAKENPNVPSNVMLKNWQERGLRQLVKYAVDNKYEFISWTNSKQQAQRYNLGKYIDKINYIKDEKTGNYKINARIVGGDYKRIAENVKSEELENYVGKEHAKKITDDIGRDFFEGKVFDVQEMKVTPDWAKNLYDKQIPNILKDITKGEIRVEKIKGRSPYIEPDIIEVEDILKKQNMFRYSRDGLKEAGLEADIGPGGQLGFHDTNVGDVLMLEDIQRGDWNYKVVNAAEAYASAFDKLVRENKKSTVGEQMYLRITPQIIKRVKSESKD